MPFEIIRNDITRMRVDAIVNAANHSLLGGGGVDGAIHRAAGPKLLEECRGLNGCATGEAKITGGYRLPAKYVIHTVGPVWRGGGHGEPEQLRNCYRNALKLADERGLDTVAFPLISSGAYGYPVEQAMAVAVESITGFLVDHDMTVYLVVLGKPAFLAGKKLFRDVKAYVDDVFAETYADANLQARRDLWREEARSKDAGAYADAAPRPCQPCAAAAPDWKALLRRTDEGFSEALLRLIDQRGLTDAQCYKRANVDRKLFSKIRSNPAYKPSKSTVCAFAVALRLNLEETRQLLNRAGFALTHSSRFDIVLEYCVQHGIYDVNEINEVLFQFDMPLLGSGRNEY